MREKEAWKKYSSEKKQQVMEFAETYRRFISDCKTERECVDEIKKQALQAGFEDMQEVIASGNLQTTKAKAWRCILSADSLWSRD